MPTVITEQPAERAPAGPPETTDPASDAELIEASLHDPGRFAAIFDRHADAIVRYAAARVGGDLAEDVTAGTFLAAFGRRRHYDLTRPDARPWLYGIAVREIGKHRRAEVMRQRMLAAVPAERFTGDFGDRLAERVTAEQLGPRLAAALSDLPRRDRELLLLIAWADLSYAQAAEALGLSVSAVRSRLNRIRVRLRKALGGANPANADDNAGEGKDQ
jgi:RNA polymerase sigma factor (sigma-70 family)